MIAVVLLLALGLGIVVVCLRLDYKIHSPYPIREKPYRGYDTTPVTAQEAAIVSNSNFKELTPLRNQVILEIKYAMDHGCYNVVLDAKLTEKDVAYFEGLGYTVVNTDYKVRPDGSWQGRGKIS